MKFDIIGDVHGCKQELIELINKLGYQKQNGHYYHPDDRQLIFAGDITDRGPQSIQTIGLVYQLVYHDKIAIYIPGNHCDKLYRYFLGNNVQIRHGLETTVEEFLALSEKNKTHVKEQFMSLYENAPLYFKFEPLKLIVAHAGIPEKAIGRKDKKVKSFVLYGDVTGQTHEDGRPVRRDWAADYQGEYWIVYGHTPVLEPRFLNKTVNIDLGCVFGHRLAAFRFPEKQIETVDSTLPFQAEKFTNFD
ncbi:protein phosphatase/bis(5'-nucleosyl)-tetraphosphatase (symmetrical) [Pelagirhabdus alkalitolerans]|uniref:Protein phosphatase/bis(5'-nucleosyl)-tetraphosphatase (Symmetrical) n=1 Tax=Pelagirhabdus alkalitolerans TaxID=1612202 RepID=A0A1G6KDR6_9BACI|nr:bis(5'-nucleosyl)-tetraphosphatase PrpE [Pelagirhabdus alkalitolerans]SDC29219.1 protein phosphatase/bis(5'-nucleosyl)-tetraphosphatase (symmetrical) [Pelagirhabdus alkalitolerans]